MKEYSEILAQIKNAYYGKLLTEEIISDVAAKWQRFVHQIPVGSNVYYSGKPEDIRVTEDGRIYDDALDLYVAVSRGGLWFVEEVRKAP